MTAKEILEKSLNYNAYRELVDRLVAEGKTTGVNQTEKLIEFTKLNVQRMKRLDKTIKVSETAIAKITRKPCRFHMVVIGDAWCGDCAQIIPVLNKIAENSEGHLQLNIISRDASEELKSRYGKEGIISIPKVLIMDEDLSVVFNVWGSRPKPALEILKKWKENQATISHEEFEKELHMWYTKDKGEAIVSEIIQSIKEIETCHKKIA